MTTASVFTGVRLSNESRNVLLDLFRETFGDLLPNVKGHHLTIRFRGSPAKIPVEVMGKMVEYKIAGMSNREGIQVVELEPLGLAQEIEYSSIPHVTVAVDLGVRASAAKKLLREGGSDVAPEKDIRLFGEVGFVHDRHGWVFTHLDEDEMTPTPR